MRILFLAYTSKTYNGHGIKISRADLTRKMSCLETWVPRIKAKGHDVIFFGGGYMEQSYDELNHMLYLKSDESYDYHSLKDKNIGSLMLVRLQEAIKWCLDNKEFDYIFRVDDGTYVNAYVMDKVYALLEQGYDVIKSNEGGGGAGMFFSKNACQKLITYTNPEKIHIEDLAIWRWLDNAGLKVTNTDILCHQYILSENLFTIHYSNGKRMYFTDTVISYYHSNTPIKRKVAVNFQYDYMKPLSVKTWDSEFNFTPTFYSFDRTDTNWEHYGSLARSCYTVNGRCPFAPASIDKLLLYNINFDLTDPSQLRAFNSYIDSVAVNGELYMFFSPYGGEEKLLEFVDIELINPKDYDIDFIPEGGGNLYKVTRKQSIVVAQYWTPNLAYGKYTKAINEDYCKKKGYIYHIETDEEVINTGREGRAHTWWKPKFLLRVIEELNPSYILFLDADAVVNDDKYNIEEFIDDKFDIIATHDHGPSKINAGVILFKNTKWTKTFLQKWWDYGYTNPEFNNNFWWDQTGFGNVMDALPDADNHIKIITNRVLNWREHSQNNFIFHAFGYGNHRYRTIDVVHNKRFKIELKRGKRENAKTYVVYHCYLVKKWRELVTEQLTRLVTSGLCDKADKIYCVVIDPSNQKDEYVDLVSSIIGDKAYIEIYKDNAFEFYAISKVWDLGQREDCNILYFHTKGVFNDFANYQTGAIDELKIKTMRDWRLFMEYFCIDKWEENLKILESHDMTGTTCNNNWWWGNFWWCTSTYLQSIEAPARMGSRWDCEAWVNKYGTAKIYEHNHISFAHCFTDLPEHFYKDGLYEKYIDSDIILHEAKYGHDGKAMDEGWKAFDTPILIDVTSIVAQNLDKNNKKFIDVKVDNNVMGKDPCYGVVKGLYIKYSFSVEPDVVYNLFCVEGWEFKFPCFRKLKK